MHPVTRSKQSQQRIFTILVPVSLFAIVQGGRCAEILSLQRFQARTVSLLPEGRQGAGRAFQIKVPLTLVFDVPTFAKMVVTTSPRSPKRSKIDETVLKH